MDPAAVLAVDRRTLSEEVADRRREAILTGSLTPGQHVREEELSVALNVSRSPVRDALSPLSTEKLLIIRPYRGAVVARISIHDMEEGYTLRASLETLAVGLAIERATLHDLSALRAVAVQVPEESGTGAAREFAELDVTFHDLIYRAARHERLYSFWSLLRAHIFRFLLWRNMANDDYRNIYSSEHEELVECIAVGEVERAQAMVASHLQGAYRRLEEPYNQQQSVTEDEDDLGRQPSRPTTGTARAVDGSNWGALRPDSTGAQRKGRRNSDPGGGSLPYASGEATLTSEMEALQSTSKSKAGIALNLSQAPVDTILGKVYDGCTATKPCSDGDLDMLDYTFDWVYGPDFLPTGEQNFFSGASSNPGDYSSATNDANIKLTTIAPNHKAEITDLVKYQNYLVRNVPVVWMPNEYSRLTMYKSDLKGVVPQSILDFIFPQYYSFKGK